MSPLPAQNIPSSPLAMPLPQGQGISPVPPSTNSRTQNRTSRTSSMASDSGPSHRTMSPYSFPSSPASDVSSVSSHDGLADADEPNSHRWFLFRFLEKCARVQGLMRCTWCLKDYCTQCSDLHVCAWSIMDALLLIVHCRLIWSLFSWACYYEAASRWLSRLVYI